MVETCCQAIRADLDVTKSLYSPSDGLALSDIDARRRAAILTEELLHA
jgi:hypothetical protein